MRRLIVLMLFLSVMGPVSSLAAQCLRTVNVTSATLPAALAVALPGDCIVLADGNYAGFTVARSGTAASPIVIRAANRGLAVITSGTVRLSAVTNVVLEGLTITTSGGSATVGSDTRRFAVWFNSATACRVTRCTFALTGQSSSTYWVFLSGASYSNRVDHCEFGPNAASGNKYIFVCGDRPIPGVTPPADRTSWAEGGGAFNPNMARHTRVDRNHFRDKASGTGEVMDFGGLGVVGDYQDTFTVAEYNLFENCDGDAEIVAVKASRNTIRYNTIRTSAGMLSLRAGNRNEIYGNFILQDGKAGAGGIKLYEKDHKVFNNYIAGAQDYPLLIGSGDAYDPEVSPESGFSHAQVFRAVVVHNTVVNPARQVRIGHGSTDQLPPTDCVFANNLILGPAGQTLFSQNITPVNQVYAQNLIWPQNPNRAGFLVLNPQLTNVAGLMRLASGSPAINAASQAYAPFVTLDMDGQLRDALRDIGADERSPNPVLLRPLTPADVGPDAVEPVFTLTLTPEGGALRLGWNGGLPPYQVQMRTNIEDSVWQNVGGQVATNNVLLAPGAASGFYRVRAQ